MKAMILAAGMGERMRPLTEDRAKPSLPLLNRPMIMHTLSYLKGHGVKEAVINLHYEPESIRGPVGDGTRAGIKVHYSEEPIILGTAGGLKKAEGYFQGSGTFVMINSDFVTNADLGTAVKEHTKAGAQATLILIPERPGTSYGRVQIDKDGRVVSIAGRPSPGSGPGYTFTGIHIIEPDVIKTIPPGVPFEINQEVYPAIIKKGGLIRSF